MLLKRYSNPQCGTWNTTGTFDRLQKDLDQLFNRTTERTWLPAVEVSEGREQFLITVDLPGVDPDNVKVAIEDDVLTIAGERKFAATEGSEVRLSERAYGQFQRAVRLPSPVQINNVTASSKHGILTITLPKTEEAKPREIKVAVA